jgi:hypothetical protein
MRTERSLESEQFVIADTGGGNYLKRLLFGFGLCAIAAALVISAKPQDKLDWCHFPPGQWTGDRATSKALILNISENAIPGHLNHPGDGPVNFESDYPNLSPLGASCTGACGDANALASDPKTGLYWITVHLTGPNCVCPVGTERAGNAPVPAQDSTASTGKTCGGGNG